MTALVLCCWNPPAGHLSARSIELRDEAGRVRMRLGVRDTAPFVELLDRESKACALLMADDDWSAFSLVNSARGSHIEIGVDSDGAWIDARRDESAFGVALRDETSELDLRTSTGRRLSMGTHSVHAPEHEFGIRIDAASSGAGGLRLSIDEHDEPQVRVRQVDGETIDLLVPR